MWYGSGNWVTAVSIDGINFTPAGPKFSSRFSGKHGGGSTDGTGIFIDDDGTDYVAFAAMVIDISRPVIAFFQLIHTRAYIHTDTASRF